MDVGAADDQVIEDANVQEQERVAKTTGDELVGRVRLATPEGWL
jgi:hypothetical protein